MYKTELVNTYKLRPCHITSHTSSCHQSHHYTSVHPSHINVLPVGSSSFSQHVIIKSSSLSMPIIPIQTFHCSVTIYHYHACLTFKNSVMSICCRCHCHQAHVTFKLSLSSSCCTVNHYHSNYCTLNYSSIKQVNLMSSL